MTNRKQRSAKVLVTGAAGKLGSVVVQHLADSGLDVIPTDRVEGSVGSLSIRTADLADPEPLAGLLHGVTAVVHCAGWPGRGGELPRNVLAWNVEGTLNLCKASLAAGIERFVYASSVQVFASRVGPEEGPPTVEYLPLDGNCLPNPRNLYAFSKAVGEVLVRTLLSTAGVQCQSLRFPWLVNPVPGGQWGRRLEPFDVEEAKIEAEQGFVCLSLRDAARLILACLSSTLPGYRTYYPAVSVVPPEHLGRYLERYYAGVDLRRPHHEMHSLVDLSAIEADTGWVPHDIPDRSVVFRDRGWVRRILERLR